METMHHHEVIILAGGLGTRLRSEIGAKPKCLALVNGRPFMWYLVNYLKSQGSSGLIFSLGFGSEEVISLLPEICGDLAYSYVVENEPLGTGGAISLALTKSISDSVFVVNGDTMFPANLTTLMEFHKKTNAGVTVALKRMVNFDRYGAVDIDASGVITRFNEKTFCTEGYINGGIYVINKDWWNSLKLPEKFSVEKSVLEQFCTQGLIRGLPFEEYFIDIGIPEDYHRASVEFVHHGFF